MALKIDYTPVACTDTICVSHSLSQAAESSRSSGLTSLTPQCTGVFWVISMQMCISMQDHTGAFNSPAEELILWEGMLFSFRHACTTVNTGSKFSLTAAGQEGVWGETDLAASENVWDLGGSAEAGWKAGMPLRILTWIENSALPVPKTWF